MLIDLIVFTSTLFSLTSFNSTFNETNYGSYDPNYFDFLLWDLDDYTYFVEYDPSDYELAVLEEYLTLPDIARACFFSKLAEFAANNAYDDVADEGNGNAYRHLYWTFLLSYNFGVNFAYDFVVAHEMAEADGNAKDMDLHNDAITIKLFEDWQRYFYDINGTDLANTASLSTYAMHCVRPNILIHFFLF